MPKPRLVLNLCASTAPQPAVATTIWKGIRSKERLLADAFLKLIAGEEQYVAIITPADVSMAAGIVVKNGAKALKIPYFLFDFSTLVLSCVGDPDLDQRVVEEVYRKVLTQLSDDFDRSLIDLGTPVP